MNLESTQSELLNVLFHRNAGCISAPLENETAILDPETGLYFGLNEIGSIIWNLLENPITPSQLCTHITNDFDVDPQTCLKDILVVLAEMESHRLIARNGAPN